MTDEPAPAGPEGAPVAEPADAETACAVLGVEPGVSPEDLEKAWRYHRTLYDETSVATYSLLEPDERRRARARVDAAYALLRARAASASSAARDESGAAARTPPAKLEGDVTGAALRRFREERGVELRHIARVSRVPLRTLEDIEADRADRLPPTVYLRGFLVEYAREVGLDPAATAAAFLLTLRR